ncbi:DUF4352 domain-containing protein [Amphibacillus jilinensis]|uniref:DUF4352 domain-containing protein n=1 Tax=Amphibacillus jilinensis TaxID=1216008 RepID=UPI0002ED0F94|nr:DUF4352 domain-containing protein [Amphibacillus jilinensis]
MKKLVVLLLSLSVLIVVVACGNQSGEQDEETTDEAAEQQEDNDDQGASEDMENDSDSTEAGSDGEYLRLGETGVMETILGDYEVTPTSVRYVAEMTEDDPIVNPNSDTFIVIDTIITNIGDEPMNADDAISQARLHNMRGGGTGRYKDFVSIDNIEGELAPGESIEGEILFDLGFEEEYDLSFGSTALESASNVQEWKIYEDEIDSE